MSQQINLYNAAFIPPREWVTPKSLFVMSMVSVMVVVVGGVWAQRSAVAWEHEAQVAQAAQEEALAAFDVARKALEARQPDAALALKLAQERDKLAQRERTLQATHVQLTASHKGFSPYVKGLAQQAVPGVWITGLTIAEQPVQLSLSGRAMKKELVPEYVRRLNAEPVFAGKTFAGLDITQVVPESGKPSLASAASAPQRAAGVLEFHLVAARSDPAEAKN